MKTFTFVNQSCYRRQEEIATIRRFFFMNGYSEDTNLASADLVILFTCAFCRSRVLDMLAEIARIQSAMKKGGELMVGSCLPKTDSASLKEVFAGKTITPTCQDALDTLPGITVSIREVQKLCAQEAACTPLLRRIALPGASQNDGHQLGVFIASGCRRKCSYCAIRFATGPLKSKPLDVVKRTFSEGLDQGCRKFEVYADSIGDYGLDIGTSLGELLEWLGEGDRPFSIGIYDLHPQSFLKYLPQLLNLCQAGRMHYLYVPVQSGAARILKLMNRDCRVQPLLEGLRQVKQHPGVFLQTSIIVGFPSETDADFEDTLRLLQDVRFDDVYAHCYSDMPGTESASLPDKVSREVMQARLERLDRSGIPHGRDKAKRELDSVSPVARPALLGA